MKNVLLILGLVVAGGVGSVAVPQGDDYVRLGPRGDLLRQAFNDDSGKVRVIMLVAPT